MRAYFQRTFYALENPQFRTLWFGTLFSFLGMQMQVIARGYLAYDLTHKNSALGGVMLAFGVPQLFLSLYGGVLADRVPKRKLLVICHTVVAVNSAWLAFMILSGSAEFWMLIVSGLVQGAGFAFIGPARQAFITELVQNDQIGNAVVLQQMSMNSTRVIGPSIAGVFIGIAFLGVGGVYVMTTLGFVIAGLNMLRLPSGAPAPKEQPTSAMTDMTDGLRYLRSKPGVMLLIAVSFATVMMGFPYQSFLPSLTESVFHEGATQLGFLSSTGAVGAVLATLAVATWAGHQKAAAVQPLLAMAFGASVMGLAVAPNFVTALIMMVFVGGLASAFQSLNNALTMSATDREYHGRVQSISMLSWSLFSLVALPLGYLADAVGLRETLAFMGAVVILSVAAIEAVGRITHASDLRSAGPVIIAITEPAQADSVAGGR